MVLRPHIWNLKGKERKSSVLMLLLVIFQSIASYFFFHWTLLTYSPALFKNVFTLKHSEDVKRPRLQITLPLLQWNSESHCLSYRKRSSDEQNLEKETQQQIDIPTNQFTSVLEWNTRKLYLQHTNFFCVIRFNIIWSSIKLHSPCVWLLLQILSKLTD